MSSTVTSIPDGNALPLASLPETIEWAGSFVSTITVVYENKTYVQTFTNDGTNITAISGWVLQ